jgi:putative DNA primase/helicase
MNVRVPPKTVKELVDSVLDKAGRPEIHLRAGDIERIVDESQDALIKADRGLYQRDGRIVSISTVVRVADKGAEVRIQSIAERGDHVLREDMSSAASFQKYDARKKGMVATDPPLNLVQTLKQRDGARLRFPVLAGVINAPTMRWDGTILAGAGYDAATKLLFDPNGVEFPMIPEKPTRKDAEAALAKLLRLLADFPFVTDAHRSVALSAVLTAPVRRTLRSAPLHAYSAPGPGAGKGMLTNLGSIIAIGCEAPVTTQAGDEEFEKRLAASLFAGDQIISIDNCSRPLGGDLLCQMLTEQSVKPRILGESRNPTRSTGAFVVANGNNLRVAGDMTRRSIICRLNPGVERPELRNGFAIPNLLDFAKENRPELVAAVLTILRAYHVAGAPDKPAPLGSFAGWSDRVRGALLWLGQADPVLTMDEVRAEDPELAALRAVAGAWRDAFPGETVTVADVIKAVSEQKAGSYGEAKERAHEALHEVLMTVAGRGSSISGQALGFWLSAVKGRIVDAMTFEHMGARRSAAAWRLAQVD